MKKFFWELKYRALEWVWTIKYLWTESRLCKYWRRCRLLAHNRAVEKFWVASGMLPLPEPIQELE